jgi:fluoride exporter
VGKLFLAGIGGFVGSALRYAVTGFIQPSNGSTRFPFGTLTVNLVGCLLIGFLSELAELRGIYSADTRTLIFVGVLGGFTTFSAFGHETMLLWRDGEVPLAFANIAAHVVLCLGAVWLSRTIAFQIWG